MVILRHWEAVGLALILLGIGLASGLGLALP